MRKPDFYMVWIATSNVEEEFLPALLRLLRVRISGVSKAKVQVVIFSKILVHRIQPYHPINILSTYTTN